MGAGRALVFHVRGCWLRIADRTLWSKVHYVLPGQVVRIRTTIHYCVARLSPSYQRQVLDASSVLTRRAMTCFFETSSQLFLYSSAVTSSLVSTRDPHPLGYQPNYRLLQPISRQSVWCCCLWVAFTTQRRVGRERG